MRYCPILYASPLVTIECLKEKCEWYESGCPAHPIPDPTNYFREVETFSGVDRLTLLFPSRFNSNSEEINEST